MRVDSGHFIPGRFREAVLMHLVLNWVDWATWPVVLGIGGRAGDGKTYQLHAVLADAGVQVVSVNAADLESDRAGEPGKRVLHAYVDASHHVSGGEPSAFVIDDFDTTVGEWELNTGTVNHQQVVAQLMHIADFPTLTHDGVSLARAPVLVTGNDLGKLYEPLRRPGRMHAMAWRPTPDELRQIVTAIFDGIATADAVAEAVDAFPDQVVSFFAQLRDELLADRLRPLALRLAKNPKTVLGSTRRFRKMLEADAETGLDGSVDLVALARRLEIRSREGTSPFLTPSAQSEVR